MKPSDPAIFIGGQSFIVDVRKADEEMFFELHKARLWLSSIDWFRTTTSGKDDLATVIIVDVEANVMFSSPPIPAATLWRG